MLRHFGFRPYQPSAFAVATLTVTSHREPLRLSTAQAVHARPSPEPVRLNWIGPVKGPRELTSAIASWPYIAGLPSGD
jgi:hypothetical protein